MSPDQPHIDIHNEMLLKISLKVACFSPVMYKLHAGSIFYFVCLENNFFERLISYFSIFRSLKIPETFPGVEWVVKTHIRYVKVAFH